MTDNNHILIIALAKYYGGAEVRVLHMARMLRGVSEYVVVVIHNSTLHKQLLLERLPVISISYKRADPRIVCTLIGIIKNNNCTIIDTHNPQSHLWGLIAAKYSGVKNIVTTVHGCYGDAEIGWRSLFYNAVLRLNNFLGSQFIAVSTSVENYLLSLSIKKQSIFLSHNAIQPLIVKDTRVSIRKLCQWSEDSIIIVITARLEPVKGINDLIEAFAMAVNNNKKLRLCIIGEGRSQEELKKQVTTLQLDGKIVFTGFRQDVVSLLKTADLFCLPSLSEGLPFAVLEAALSHLPLALSKVGGLNELFEQDKTAIFFPPNDPGAQSRALLYLADNPSERIALGKAACRLVSNRFSPEIMLEQVLKVYGITLD